MFDLPPKSPLKSKTILGAVIAVLPAALGLFGIEMSPADATGVVGHVESIVTAVGSLVAIWGRLSAKQLVKI